MMSIPENPKPEIIDLLDRLSLKNLYKVLDYIKMLPLISEGVSGNTLAEYFAQHPVSSEDAEEMQRIIQDIEDGKL